MSNKGILNQKEQCVMYHLVEAWNAYVVLEKQHPSEQKDFSDSIHRCQDLLGIRIARRTDPTNFKTFVEPLEKIQSEKRT